MLLILIPLFVASILSLVSGAVWLLLASGQVERREGQDAGENLVAEIMQDPEDDAFIKKTAFRGDAKTLNAKVSFSFPEIKEEIRSGHWKTVAPLLMTVGGFLGVLLFGSLALLVALDDKLLGAFIAVVSIVTIVRVLVAMIRA